MIADVEPVPRAPIVLSFATNLAIALTLFTAGAIAIFVGDAHDPALHTVLDTSVALTGALVALLLWDISRRVDQSLPLLLAISFAFLSIAETLHVMAVLGWLGGGVEVDIRMRAGTWGPAAYLLPLGVGAALWLRDRPRAFAWPFALGLAVLGGALTAFFLIVPRYTAPGLFWITRPTLALVPLLWLVVGWAYWKRRGESQIARAIALFAIVLLLAHLVMLYSRSPSDSIAMVAHLGKIVGDVLLLFNLTQIGAADTIRRSLAEAELLALNRELHSEQQQSRQLIETIFENSPAVIYVKDLEGRYLMVNRRYAEVFELDRAAITGKTDHELFPKKAADAFRAMDSRVVTAAQALTEEEMAPQADGPHHFISVKSPLRDQSDQVYAIFGISTDVTEQRRAEEALRASEQRNRLIVESALDAVVTIDGAGVITGWNSQAEAIFGWQRSEALGRRVDEIIMPERFRGAHREGLARHIATGDRSVLDKRVELVALRRDGEEFPIELSITSIGTDDTLSFSAFVRDITERKVAETRLQTQRDRLHLLEQITRAIGKRHDVESIFQVVVRTLEDRLPADFVCICRYDRVAHMLTVANVGVGSEPLGRELGMVEKGEVPIDRNGLSRCVAGELVYEPDLAEVDFPFPVRLAREGLRSLVIAPLAIEDEVFGVLVVARVRAEAFLSADCEFLRQLGEHVALAAHQAQLRDSLQRAYDDLKLTQQAALEQERMRAIGQMASGIAHDINNAISPVAVYTQSIIERDLALPQEVREYLELVGRVTKDVAATVGRMRDFYRGDEEVELVPLDLNELVPQVIELTRARWSDMPQQRGTVIKVSSELGSGLPQVMGNASELREALTNLVFNAVDAMPEGGTLTIKTFVDVESRNRRRVRLEVCDTGPGMDEEIRNRCLDPFFTTKGERGTGLGLAMVQGVALRHKAELNIDSAPGKGTCVVLEFGAVRDTQQARKSTEVPTANIPRRLLIIDDDPAVLTATAIVLKTMGHDVITADGGQAGIDALRGALAAGETFDVVITDLGMPYVDGNQVARSVKELCPTMPVVLLTGWGRRLTTGEKAPAHVDFLLPKPLDLGELRDVLARLD
jgi:PAS domain S-box-containing protein